jgi:site-specific DNA-methyltransferase (adenine-specific)
MKDPDAVAANAERSRQAVAKAEELGRWPANLIHDGSDEVVGLFPQTGVSSGGKSGHTGAYCGGFKQEHYGDAKPGFGDKGSAARFFYCAKSSKRDRDEGLEGLPLHDVYSEAAATPMRDQREQAKRANHHPTVKPTDLMRYLCRLVTPPNGVVLDPFMGSGSTGKAAMIEGFRFIGIERELEYVEIAKARIDASLKTEHQADLFA